MLEIMHGGRRRATRPQWCQRHTAEKLVHPLGRHSHTHSFWHLHRKLIPWLTKNAYSSVKDLYSVLRSTKLTVPTATRRPTSPQTQGGVPEAPRSGDSMRQSKVRCDRPKESVNCVFVEERTKHGFTLERRRVQSNLTVKCVFVKTIFVSMAWSFFINRSRLVGTKPDIVTSLLQ